MDDKLQKLMAHAGLGSRREIEKWISHGRISVNGKRATLGDRASENDRILLDGRLVALQSTRAEQIKALMYHKPEGEICTRKDPQGRPTVFDNLPGIPNGRWVSVGRLDINTSGLILFTNSGDLANTLMHPSTGLEREYLVRIRGRAKEQTIQTLVGKGVDIDGKPAKFESVMAADMAEEGTNHWYRVIIKEGRYREVRRIWDAVGHTVSRLKRVRYGTIKLNRDLKRGQVAKLAPLQLEKLVTAVGLRDQFAKQLYSGGQSTGAKKAAKRIADRGRNAGKKIGIKTGTKPARRGRNTSFEKTMKSGSGSSTDGSRRSNSRSTQNRPSQTKKQNRRR